MSAIETVKCVVFLIFATASFIRWREQVSGERKGRSPPDTSPKRRVDAGDDEGGA